MNLHIHIRDSNPIHTHITVFIEGASTGTLCLRTVDVATFCMILRNGKSAELDTYKESGKLWTVEDQTL